MGRISILLLCGVLAGCQTKPFEAMSYAEMTALANQIDARCAAQKAGPGTPAYRTCFQQEARRENYNREMNRQMLGVIGSVGEGMSKIESPKVTQCMSSPWGSVTCTSN